MSSSSSASTPSSRLRTPAEVPRTPKDDRIVFYGMESSLCSLLRQANDNVTTELSISRCKLLLSEDDDTIRSNSKLERLCFDRVNFRVSELRTCLAFTSSSLLELSLNHCQVSDEMVKLICLSTALQNLQKISLEHNAITDFGCFHLASMLRRRTRLGESPLQELFLSGNRIGNEGLEQLSLALAEHDSSLESLYLDDNPQISSSGVQALFDNLSMTINAVKILSLNGCHGIGDKGARILAEFASSDASALMVLNLSDCNLTDVTCKAFEDAVGDSNWSICKLRLRGNHFTKHSVTRLRSAAEQSESLEELSLSEVTVDEELKQSVQKHNKMRHAVDIALGDIETKEMS